MRTKRYKYVYGPVASRRLGRSLGVDLVPFKTCTYDCVYCQLGRTTNLTIRLDDYVPVGDLLAEVEAKLAGPLLPDFVSLAGSGEPTLHAGIGEVVQGIKRMTRVPVAVITNGSMLWSLDVQASLMEADLLLPSLDAGDAGLFQQVNRPHSKIEFEAMVNGIAEFTRRFRKPVWLEVFLLEGVTGTPEEVQRLADRIRHIRPAKVQLNTVSRPPSEEGARSVPPERLAALAALFDPAAEVISEGFAGGTAAAAGSATDADILALIRIRPCTAEGVAAGLGLHIHESAKRLADLCDRGEAVTVRREHSVFYETVRSSPGRRASG
ncbi:MAG: radical SAM protein [Desulfobacterales bacterium]|jgi:wyosine [tRNA(Phe)-imidazoG37] synthetase (radical SAM superfamily)|nr:radical SAM protein [Desulfobacterales bacterium]